MDTHDLTGRVARCSYYGGSKGCTSERPSDPSLAFFEYRGPGHALRNCAACGYYDTVHQSVNPATGRPGITNHEYEPIESFEWDRFYCGCWGWD